jgi:hypothetical protein
MLENKPSIADFLSDGPFEGMEKFLLPEKMAFAHGCRSPEESHLIETDVIYLKRKKSFVFCSIHKEYVDVSVTKSQVQK